MWPNKGELLLEPGSVQRPLPPWRYPRQVQAGSGSGEGGGGVGSSGVQAEVPAPAGGSCVILGTLLALAENGHRMQNATHMSLVHPPRDMRMDWVALTLGLGAPSGPLRPRAILFYQKSSHSLPCSDSVVPGRLWSSFPAQAPCQELQAVEVAGAPLANADCPGVGQCPEGQPPHHPGTPALPEEAIHHIATRWRSFSLFFGKNQPENVCPSVHPSLHPQPPNYCLNYKSDIRSE